MLCSYITSCSSVILEHKVEWYKKGVNVRALWVSWHLFDEKYDVHGRGFFLLCLKSREFFCAVFFEFFKVDFLITDHFFLLGCQLKSWPQAPQPPHTQRAIVWHWLWEVGWVVSCPPQRGHPQSWSWGRGGSSGKTHLRPRWGWAPALLGQHTAWRLLLLIAKITYSVHYASITLSHRCKILPAS